MKLVSLHAVSLLAAATAALAVGVSTSTHEPKDPVSSLLSLWPARVDASLLVDGEQESGPWTVRADHGRILSVESTSRSVVLPQMNASSISSMQITWIAPSTSSTQTTLNRIFSSTSISALPVLFSTGVHIHVVANPSRTSSSVHDQDVDVKAAVDALLRVALNISSASASGVAQSPCAASDFQFHHTTNNASCFSASFAYDTLPVSSDTTTTRVVQALGDTTLRLHSVVVSQHRDGQPGFVMDTLTISEVLSSSVVVLAAVAGAEDQNRVAVVTRIDEGRRVASVRSLTTTGRATTRTTTTKLPLRAAIEANVSVAILGEGFHRRVRIDSVPAAAPWCLRNAPATTTATLRVVVSLPSSMYADLDELRRMERFGELTLHSATKHIEIERPTAVSSQHVIVLDFPVNTSKSSHAFEFPIHLRYQSPSNSSFYALATMEAPELFLSCGDLDTSTTAAEPEDGANLMGDILLTKWISPSTTSQWQRVTPPAPLTMKSVPVPVGFTPHGQLVSVVTLSVTALGALVLGYVAITSSRTMSGCHQSHWKPKTK